MKRIGYIGIILSYLCFEITAVVSIWFLPDDLGYVSVIGAVAAIVIYLVSLYLVERGKKNQQAATKLDNCLKHICRIPVYVILLPVILIVWVIGLVNNAKNSFSKQTKPLIKMGFAKTKTKQGKKKVYRFAKGDCHIRIIDNESYEISIDGGATFVSVAQSSIGSQSEREEVLEELHKYNTCDYRDQDLYQPTAKFVQFLVKNL